MTEDAGNTQFGDLASEIEKAAEEAMGGGEAPTTDDESAADVLIKVIKEEEEQAKIYAHDVDEDDPPERTGPYPAGGPS